MAILRKDGKVVNLSRGIYLGMVKDFKPRGLKKTKKGNVFESGDLEILLKNGVSVSQFVMVTPYNKYLFYKFANAVGLANKIDEYVYSLEEAEEFIQYQKARDELKRRNGMLDMNFIEMMNERREEIASNFNNTQEVEVNEVTLGDEYEEFIGI